MDHGNESATYPSIEVERALSRAQGLLNYLQKELPEIWMRSQAKDIQHELKRARSSFRDYMMDVSDQRMRLIEQVSCASE